MYGDGLHVKLKEGLRLYGMACPEHGLRYSQVAQPFDCIAPAKLNLHNGAPRPSRGARILCDICGVPLGYPDLLYNGNVELPDSCLAELQEVAKGLED